jgi:uncharacterized Fe-S cluster-containing protein
MTQHVELPGLDCGLCGFRKCAELAAKLPGEPGLLARCIHISEATAPAARGNGDSRAAASRPVAVSLPIAERGRELSWQDSLSREFDFYLEHFPEEPGPRECILPHNPLITREMNVRAGDLLIGRPLGMSCGCPITHCGIAMSVDQRTGVIDWCVTGPLRVRQEGFKDLGYYIAEAYDGLIRHTRTEIRIGCRYYFQPRMCMLQWRHSGLVNFLNKTDDGLQVRLEGLWIG